VNKIPPVPFFKNLGRDVCSPSFFWATTMSLWTFLARWDYSDFEFLAARKSAWYFSRISQNGIVQSEDIIWLIKMQWGMWLTYGTTSSLINLTRWRFKFVDFSQVESCDHIIAIFGFLKCDHMTQPVRNQQTWTFVQSGWLGYHHIISKISRRPLDFSEKYYIATTWKQVESNQKLLFFQVHRI
jgi:hypothetical protein